MYLQSRVSPRTIHPAIKFAIDQLVTTIQTAQKSERQIMLYLPLGRHSHEGERAACSALRTKISNRYKNRFTNNDMQYFYTQLKSLCDKYQDTVKAVTIHLEGGYTDSVNQKQVESIINFLLKSTPMLSRKRDSDAFFSSSTAGDSPGPGSSTFSSSSDDDPIQEGRKRRR